MFKLEDILKLLSVITALAGALPEFQRIFAQMVSTFNETDQERLKAAYKELMADNDAAYADLMTQIAQAIGEQS